jgi:hypothetical protein
MAFEQPGSQFLAEQASPVLTLRKGDQMVLFGGGKHALEDVVGGGQPLVPQLFPSIVLARRGGSHWSVSLSLAASRANVVSLNATIPADAQKRNCTPCSAYP